MFGPGHGHQSVTLLFLLKGLKCLSETRNCSLELILLLFAAAVSMKIKSNTDDAATKAKLAKKETKKVTKVTAAKKKKAAAVSTALSRTRKQRSVAETLSPQLLKSFPCVFNLRHARKMPIQCRSKPACASSGNRQFQHKTYITSGTERNPERRAND